MTMMTRATDDDRWRTFTLFLFKPFTRTVFFCFLKVCHIRRNTNFTGWQRDRYQDDHHDLRVTKSHSTLWLVHRDPHRGLLRKYTKFARIFKFVYFLNVLSPPMSTNYLFRNSFISKFRKQTQHRFLTYVSDSVSLLD